MCQLSLLTVTQDVKPPKRLDQPQRMQSFVEHLRRCGYDLAGCAKRVDVFPRLGVNFWQTFRPERPLDFGHPVDTLIALLSMVVDSELINSGLMSPRLLSMTRSRWIWLRCRIKRCNQTFACFPVTGCISPPIALTKTRRLIRSCGCGPRAIFSAAS